jgi:hypothetical protein
MEYSSRKNPYVYQLMRDGSMKQVPNVVFNPDIKHEPFPEKGIKYNNSNCIGCKYFGWCDPPDE